MHQIYCLLNGCPALSRGAIDEIGACKDPVFSSQRKGFFNIMGLNIFIQAIPDLFRATFHAVADLNAAGLPHPI